MSCGDVVPAATTMPLVQGVCDLHGGDCGDGGEQGNSHKAGNRSMLRHQNLLRSQSPPNVGHRNFVMGSMMTSRAPIAPKVKSDNDAARIQIVWERAGQIPS